MLETEAELFVWEEELLSEKEEKQMSQLERVLSLASVLWYLLSGIVIQPTQGSDSLVESCQHFSSKLIKFSKI